MGALIIGLLVVSICLLIYSLIELVKSKKEYKKISDKNLE